MMGRNWNGSCEDWLHGDEPYGFDLPDADEYPPMEQWEIDEAKAEILADEERLGKLEVIK